MQELTDILKTITEEMQKALSARTAVGDPVTVEGKTIIPLMSVGMGFGAGSSSGKEDISGGSGGGGGLGMKPVAVIIIDQQGVRVERLKETQTHVNRACGRGRAEAPGGNLPQERDACGDKG